MLGFISKLFGGSKSQKGCESADADCGADQQILSSSINPLSHDELRGKTAGFKERIREHLSETDS